MAGQFSDQVLAYFISKTGGHGVAVDFKNFGPGDSSPLQWQGEVKAPIQHDLEEQVLFSAAGFNIIHQLGQFVLSGRIRSVINIFHV